MVDNAFAQPTYAKKPNDKNPSVDLTPLNGMRDATEKK